MSGEERFELRLGEVLLRLVFRQRGLVQRVHVVARVAVARARRLRVVLEPLGEAEPRPERREPARRRVLPRVAEAPAPADVRADAEVPRDAVEAARAPRRA